MRFLDLLRKLGVIRFGAKKTFYTSGKDRPIEFMADGVFNAEKELTTKEDLKQVPGKPSDTAPTPSASACPKCGTVTKPSAKFCASCGSPVSAPSALGCSKCGAAIKPGAKFCSSCGVPVIEVAIPPAVQIASSSSKNWVLPMILVIVGITGFMIIVGVTVKKSGRGRNETTGIRAVSMDPVTQEKQHESDITPTGKATRNLVVDSASPVAGTDNSSAVPDELESWTPKTTKDITVGPPNMEYAPYENKKFGFVTELPARWESKVKNDAHVFSGRKGTEQYNTTVNFQIITKLADRSIKDQADEILSQWMAMDEFKLDQTNKGDMNGHEAMYMVASFSLPNGETFQQMQAIIQRDPYYYMIGYTAPKKLFTKYYFVVIHLLEKFQFTEIEKKAR